MKGCACSSSCGLEGCSFVYYCWEQRSDDASHPSVFQVGKSHSGTAMGWTEEGAKRECAGLLNELCYCPPAILQTYGTPVEMHIKDMQ